MEHEVFFTTFITFAVHKQKHEPNFSAYLESRKVFQNKKFQGFTDSTRPQKR